MRLLFLLALVLIVVWWWRSRLPRPAQRDETPPPPSQEEPQAMVTCAHCGLHLPSSEGLVGKNGTYCCAEHQNAADH